MMHVNVSPVYTVCFHQKFHDKCCLRKSIKQTENGLDTSVKHYLNSVKIVGPETLLVLCKLGLVYVSTIGYCK